LRRRVILPFAREQFRESSVVDRPGDWGSRYDRVLDEVEGQGELVVAGFGKDDDGAYTAANTLILKEAAALAREVRQERLAVVVWDGHSRGPEDITEHFLHEAARNGFRTAEVGTIR
jgi:hypothetical protein